MTRLLDVYRRASRDQVVGVSAQIVFAAPALVASLLVSRWGGVSLVASLALTVSVSSTIYSATSFGLTPYLALFGVRDYSQEVFWLNRAFASLVALVLGTLLLGLVGAPLALTVAAVLLRCSDGMADIAFGLDLLRVSPSYAMQRLFGWSLMRLTVFSAATFAAHFAGLRAEDAVLAGAITQFTLMLPWKAAGRVMVTRDRLMEAVRLGRGAAHLSVASTACGVLVTTPRLVAPYVVAASDIGYVGVAFIASTLIGMCFNVAWLRLADNSRTSNPRRAMAHFIIEGALLGGVLWVGMWISRPWAARAYSIAGPRFGKVLMMFGSAYILLYFVMSMANLLKLSNTRLAEARAYVITALVLAASTLLSGSLLIGLVAAAAALAVIVFLEVRTVVNGTA